jgi:hypothetical protein
MNPTASSTTPLASTPRHAGLNWAELIAATPIAILFNALRGSPRRASVHGAALASVPR